MSAVEWIVVIIIILIVLAGVGIAIYLITRKKTPPGKGTGTNPFRNLNNAKTAPPTTGDKLSIISRDLFTESLFGLTNVGVSTMDIVGFRDTTATDTTCGDFSWEYGTSGGVTDTLAAQWITDESKKYLSAQFTGPSNTPVSGDTVMTGPVTPVRQTQWNFKPTRPTEPSFGFWCLKNYPEFCLYTTGSITDKQKVTIQKFDPTEADPFLFSNVNPLTPRSTPACNMG